MFIVIVFRLGTDRPSGLLFFSCPLYFFPYSRLILCSNLFFFVLFHTCCSHAPVFGKTLLHEFLISYSHTECYLFFQTVQLQMHAMCIRSEN